MNKYIVIASGGIGGAEKRFYDLFLEMRKRDKRTYLIAPSCLLKILNKRDFEGPLEGIISFEMERWSPIIFIVELAKFIFRSKRTDVFHYPLNPLFFLHLIPRRKFSMSLCYCYGTPKLDIKNKALSLQWMASHFASKIDVLNEVVYSDFISEVPKLKEKLTLTPGGTFVSSDEPSVKTKNCNIVFLSRLEKGKGIDLLFEIIPIMNNFFVEQSHKLSFDVYGQGSLEKHVLDEVNKLKKNGIQVEYHGFVDSSEVFPQSLAVLSLQELTNYPSRVVAEALISGAHVVILDSGDSRSFGQHPGIHYLEEDLKNIDKISGELMVSNGVKSHLISQQALERYSSRGYVDYFFNLLELKK